MPVAVLTEVDENVKIRDVVPVVFIANEVLREDRDYVTIALQIQALVNQMSEHHFGARHREIQIDCDWTKGTRQVFFSLLEELQRDFEVSVTIRLHQLKYSEQTGVPPVDRGTLMLYNVGDLGDFTRNSILDSRVVASYVRTNSTYALPLDLALPVFAQTVLKNNDGKLRLLTGDLEEELQTAPKYFDPLSDKVYEVLRDTVFHGFYLYKGFQLKVEAFEINEVEASTKIIKDSRLDIRSKIYYHLDEKYLENLERVIDH